MPTFPPGDCAGPPPVPQEDMAEANPVMIEVTRAAAVESRHRGAAVVVRADGTTIAAWGDAEAAIYPRSAIKPLQAMPLVASGAADAFGLSEEELALACASHIGSKRHTDLVAAWLARLALSERDLVLGAQMPGDAAAADELIREGRHPSRLHNNCSGKHAGFLTLAKHLGQATSDYARPDSAVQLAVRDVLSRLGGADLSDVAPGVDGCGVPTIPMPLAALARALARLAAPDTLEGAESGAAKRLVAAMGAHPELVRGAGGFDTEAITAAKGAFVTKVGAEGVSAAIVPARGIGIAIKIDDGARRAADVAMAHILDALGLLDADGRARLDAYLRAAVLNTRGERVGEIRAEAVWADSLAGLKTA